MNSVSPHLYVTGARKVDRLAFAATTAPSAIVADTHRQLRGPYTGVDSVLHVVLPDAFGRWPALVEDHRVELLHGMPELSDLIGAAPTMMATSTNYPQRSRFYSRKMLRSVNHGIVTFLRKVALRRATAGDGPLILVFDNVPQASDTTQELLALLVRRCDPEQLRVLVAGGPGELLPELAESVRRYTVTTPAPELVRSAETRSPDELVAAFVAGDGIGDDPAELAAYAAADPALVTRLHDERADELIAASHRIVGAAAYHREHGSDPHGAGVEALMACVQFSVEGGFSPSVIEYAERGRMITDPVGQAFEFGNLTMQKGYALVDMGLLDVGIETFTELRRRYTVAKLQMMTCYAMAMIYTRFAVPRDHELALAWQNNALAISRLLEDPEERLVQIGFQENALALIQMHRGELDQALELVESALNRLNHGLAPTEWALHRQQLLYNRARLLAVMRRPDDAYADFTTLIEQDPYFTDYLTERAKVSRKGGDLAAALADYDRAIDLAPPFPENFYTRATARLAAGDIAGALADLDYALDMEPDDADTRITRAEVYLDEGRIGDARADTLAGLAFRPDDSRLLCMLGTVEIETGELDSALTHLDAALEAEPGLPAALINRAVVHHQAGRHAAAIRDLTSVLDQFGDDPDLLLNRGIVYLADGGGEQALRDFDAALALPDADIAELRFQRGRCLLALGNHELAAAELRECEPTDEHWAEAQELLAAAP
jgi:tetratricopeptide (TPR) repeat protein